MKNIFLLIVLSMLISSVAAKPTQTGVTAIKFSSYESLIVIVKPRYPSSALANGQEGSVNMSFVVSEGGSTESIKVTESVGGVLEDAAIRALEKAIYLPDQRGKSFTARVVFTLDQ